MQARDVVFAESISDFGAFARLGWLGFFLLCSSAHPPAPTCLPACLHACLQGGAVANSDMDIVFHSSARDTIACLAKSAKGSIGLLRYDVRNIRID